MTTLGLLIRITATASGTLILVGAAGAAFAASIGSDEVDVDVRIDPRPPSGALTMSVAETKASLRETDSSDPATREFTGILPTVTIDDNRTNVPAEVYWYVTGQSSSFTATGDAVIEASYLGWMPKLLTPGDGEVAAGDDVLTKLDTSTAPATGDPNNTGLVGDELLALAADSRAAHPSGRWQASADLVLKTPTTVVPGRYAATITLTLWEDAP